MMTKTVNLLKLFSIIALAGITACNSGTGDTPGKTAEKKEKEKAELKFADASKGLPSTGLWRQRIALYDMNGDGKMDILAPPPRKALEMKMDNRPAVWYGNGRGEWLQGRLDVPPNIKYHYGATAVSDFDGDKIPDVALPMHQVSTRVLKGEGQGKYADLSDGIPPEDKFLSRAAVTADFNNDGMPDIAFASESRSEKTDPEPKGVWVCSRGDKEWKCSPIAEKEAGGLFADQLTVGDVNGDGNKDIAVASLVTWRPLVIWLGDGKGGFTAFNEGLPALPPAAPRYVYIGVVLVDIDRDGRDDLIASMSGFGKDGFYGLKAFLSRPDGFEEISEGLPNRAAFFALDSCDLDNDGSPEIVGATGEGGLKIFSRKGDAWGEVNISGLPENGLILPYGVYCRDMNGDGLKDIVMNYASDQLKLGGIRVFYNITGKDPGTKDS